MQHCKKWPRNYYRSIVKIASNHRSSTEIHNWALRTQVRGTWLILGLSWMILHSSIKHITCPLLTSYLSFKSNKRFLLRLDLRIVNLSYLLFCLHCSFILLAKLSIDSSIASLQKDNSRYSITTHFRYTPCYLYTSRTSIKFQA